MKRFALWILGLVLLAAALGGVALYMSQPMRLPAVLQGHDKQVMSLAFSPDRQVLASASDGGQVKVWDAQTGRVLRSLAPHTSLPAVCFSPDGKWLASAGGGDAKLWSTREWRNEWTTSLSIDHAVVCFTPDGETVLINGFGKTYCLSSDSGRIVATLPGHYWSMALRPDGKELVKGMHAVQVRAWPADAESFQLNYGGTRVLALAYSPDGKWLCAAGEPFVKLWTTDDWVERHSISAHKWETCAVAFSGDSRYLATAAYDNSPEAVKIWSVADGKLANTLSLKEGIGTAAATSADGQLLAVGTSNGMIHIWEWSKITQTEKGH